MADRTNGCAPGLGGEGREEKQLSDIGADSAANVGENQPKKPDLDLISWAAMGSNTKPSRTNRRVKRGWKKGGAK